MVTPQWVVLEMLEIVPTSLSSCWTNRVNDWEDVEDRSSWQSPKEVPSRAISSDGVAGYLVHGHHWQSDHATEVFGDHVLTCYVVAFLGTHNISVLREPLKLNQYMLVPVGFLKSPLLKWAPLFLSCHQFFHSTELCLSRLSSSLLGWWWQKILADTVYLMWCQSGCLVTSPAQMKSSPSNACIMVT